MSLKRLPLFLIAMFLLIPSTLFAAGYSGEIKEFNPKTGDFKIYVASRDFSKALSLENSTSITLDGKPAKPADIVEGMKATAFTSGDKLTRLSLRSDSSSRAKPKPRTPSKPDPEPMPDEPKNATKATATEGEWSQLLGPERNGQSIETDLNWNWGRSGPKPLWSQNNLGEGYSSVAVSQGMVLTMGTQNNREAVLAMSLSDGKPLWSTPIASAFQEGQGNGPRGTPTIDGDKVYALGAQGALVCLDLKTGKGLWTKNILQEFGGENIVWGISESVLIDEEKVICTPGGRGATMVALDKNSGKVIWQSQAPGNPQAGYSSPIVIDVDGVKQYVTVTHNKIIGVRAEDGKFLWEDSQATNGTANCSSALFTGEGIFYATGYGTGGSLVKLSSSGNTTRAEHAYHTRDMQNHHGGMVLLDGYLYGCSDPGMLVCLDVKTGDVKWRSRNPGKSSITFADGHLIVRSEKGPITLVEANPEKYEQVAQFDQPGRSNRPSWSYPVVAAGKLFLRDQDTLLVYDLSQ